MVHCEEKHPTLCSYPLTSTTADNLFGVPLRYNHQLQLGSLLRAQTGDILRDLAHFQREQVFEDVTITEPFHFLQNNPFPVVDFTLHLNHIQRLATAIAREVIGNAVANTEDDVVTVVSELDDARNDVARNVAKLQDDLNTVQSDLATVQIQLSYEGSATGDGVSEPDLQPQPEGVTENPEPQPENVTVPDPDSNQKINKTEPPVPEAQQTPERTGHLPTLVQSVRKLQLFKIRHQKLYQKLLLAHQKLEKQYQTFTKQCNCQLPDINQHVLVAISLVSALISSVSLSVSAAQSIRKCLHKPDETGLEARHQSEPEASSSTPITRENRPLLRALYVRAEQAARLDE